jgi:hypothetical protein
MKVKGLPSGFLAALEPSQRGFRAHAFALVPAGSGAFGQWAWFGRYFGAPGWHRLAGVAVAG